MADPQDGTDDGGSGDGVHGVVEGPCPACEGTIPANTLICPGCCCVRQFDQEQYDVLRRCSDAKDTALWNAWRESHPAEHVQLEGANLEAAHLGRANLERALLSGAKLASAQLRRARLTGAILVRANLEGARLAAADLQGSSLSRAHLARADFTLADLACSTLRMADLARTTLRRAGLAGVRLDHANLSGADLCGSALAHAKMDHATLVAANLQQADLTAADLGNADLEGADLAHANLEGANLSYARLEGADFTGARLARTSAPSATVNGRTRLWRCPRDAQTDFTGVSLASACIEPGLRTDLERNVRRLGWHRWYREQHWVVETGGRTFWWLSDYGSSTWRIVRAFVCTSLGFAALYCLFALLPGEGPLHGLEHMDDLHVPSYVLPFRAVYFSIVTMTTLGFGDIHAQPNSLLGHMLLALQVMLGYVLLAALVTRFAIIFQGATVPSVTGTKRTRPRWVRRAVLLPRRWQRMGARHPEFLQHLGDCAQQRVEALRQLVPAYLSDLKQRFRRPPPPSGTTASRR